MTISILGKLLLCGYGTNRIRVLEQFLCGELVAYRIGLIFIQVVTELYLGFSKTLLIQYSFLVAGTV